MTMDDLFILFDSFQQTLYSNDPQIAGTQEAGQQKVMYEESILMTLLGADYIQFIDSETGEWADDNLIRVKFQELFEARIRFLFDAEDD